MLRAWYNPLVPWIWFGAIVMALGGLVSLTDRRFRIGAPARRVGLRGAAAAAAGSPGLVESPPAPLTSTGSVP